MTRVNNIKTTITYNVFRNTKFVCKTIGKIPQQFNRKSVVLMLLGVVLLIVSHHLFVQ